MNILAIETSCDETAVAIITKEHHHLTVKANVISSQVALHRAWGGVVPNLAGREHAKNIIPVITQALQKAHATKNDIDLIAVTAGPGLIPALLVGVSAAKTLAYSWHKPLIGLHHIEGHIYANWLGKNQPAFPLIALIVSGGHTQIILMRDHCTYDIIGQTVDDAVGEAFDKVARMLGLPYPGGPEISRQAQNDNAEKNPYTITLPRPMIHSQNNDFSFSGIKTAVLYIVREEQKKVLQQKHPTRKSFSKEEYASAKLPETFIHAIAHEFQEAVTEVLIKKTLTVAQKYNAQSVLLAGGVSANMQLRKKLGTEITKSMPTVSYHTPAMAYCLDNAAMIGAAAAYRYEHFTPTQREQLKKGWQNVYANPSKKINDSTL